MATAAVQHSPATPSGGPLLHVIENEKKEVGKRHDVATTLYYYKEAEDGSPPAPTYVGYVYLLPSFLPSRVPSEKLEWDANCRW